MEFSYVITINWLLFDVTQIKNSNVARSLKLQVPVISVPWSTYEIKFVCHSGDPQRLFQQMS